MNLSVLDEDRNEGSGVYDGSGGKKMEVLPSKNIMALITELRCIKNLLF